MTRYYCNGQVFFKASDAKRYAKELGIEYVTAEKVYSTGESVILGDVPVNGSARRYVANSPNNMEHANY